MAKVTAYTQITTPTTDDMLYVVDSPGGTPVSKKTAVGDIVSQLHLYKSLGLGWADVRAYGALGDGITDDYAAFQLAIDSGAKRIAIPYTASGYVINHRVVITDDKTQIKGIGYPVIKTTWIDPPGTPDMAQFWFQNYPTVLKGCSIEGLVFDTSSMIGHVPTNSDWLGNIYAGLVSEFSVRDCHWIDAVSAGVMIRQGERCIIDGITAKGVLAYGGSGDPFALDGNFIQMFGWFESAPGEWPVTWDWRGGNIITNSRIDARSDTDWETVLGAANFKRNYEDYGAAETGIWRENNCAAMVAPFGLVTPETPFQTFSNNFVSNFKVGIYSETLVNNQAGKLMISDNNFYRLERGIEVAYQGDAVISNNTVYQCSTMGISGIPDNIIVEGNLLVDCNLQTTEPFTWDIDLTRVDLGTQAPSVSKNVVVSNNIIRHNTANAANDSVFMAIRVASNFNGPAHTISGVSITGNSIDLRGSGASGATAAKGAIGLYGQIYDVTLAGNTILSSPGSVVEFDHTASYDIDDGPQRVNITGNTFLNMSMLANASKVFEAEKVPMDILIANNIISNNSKNIPNFFYDTSGFGRIITKGNLIGQNIGTVGLHTAVPTTGTWRAGDVVGNATPSGGSPPGWVCTASGTFSAATDNTGDTDGSTSVITGMADTSDFSVGHYVSVSAGFATTGPYRILSKTDTTITIDVNSNAAQSNITVSTPDPVFKAMANLAA